MRKWPEAFSLLGMLQAFFFILIFSIFSGANAQQTPLTFRPFADYEHTGYLFMAGLEGHASAQAKRTLVQNLPPDVKLVLYLQPEVSADIRQKVIADYEKYISPSRLIFLSFPNGKKGFWARDSIPMPLLRSDGHLMLADAKYWDGFEPDAQIGKLFSAPILKHSYQFEGGNFMSNEFGDCFTVNSETTATIPSSMFTKYYGCRKITRLPFKIGIGHVDERARFIDAKTILTDMDSYRKTFEAQGFKVIMLPRAQKSMENYVNSVLVNGTVFVPTFNEPTDAQALQVYASLNLKVIALDSKVLSNEGMGSFHCITMNFPDVPMAVAAP